MYYWKAVLMAKRKLRKSNPDFKRIRIPITHLGKYFEVFNAALKKDDVFWFRGHADISWDLTPSALRYTSPKKRTEALSLLSDFKRYGEIKLRKAPDPNEELKWVQLAQHYGLPTRLLDWTKNAAIALYFACLEPNDKDGAVYIMNPVDLNRNTAGEARVFDPHSDAKIIKPYWKLKGGHKAKGPETVAIYPTWNSERIMLQQGVFTLHGSQNFTLTENDAPSILYVRIRKEHKRGLMNELERVGVNEMAIFPETEHLCNYLKENAELK